MSTPEIHLHRGTPEYRKASAVLFVAGFMAFSLLYVVQGTLPAVSTAFGVSPAEASLTLSLTTLPLAVAVVVAASWSEGYGRRALLIGALLGASLLTLAAAASSRFEVLLGLRILTGLVLAGLPAVAMAYVAEEFHPSALGAAMGLYISGTGLGGMTGRLGGGLISSALSWRAALAVVGGVCLLGGAWVAFQLPASRNFVRTSGPLRARIAAMREPLRDPVILRMAGCGFVLMGSLVSYFNYLQYRLVGPAFRLAPSLTALVFGLYVFGTVSANWMGRLADRRSRRSVVLLGMAIMALGATASLSGNLVVVLLGSAAMVFGFFGAHAVTSGWVNAWATQQRAQASSLYLFGYHLGSSLAGYVGGLLFGAFGWPGEVGTVVVLLLGGATLAIGLPSRARSEVSAHAAG